MFILIDGDSSYSSYDGLSSLLEDAKLLMKKMDKELTLFSIGPENILGLVREYSIINEQQREKRVKHYAYTPDMAKGYGLDRFDYYINLISDSDLSLQKITEEFKIV
jgi:hypothetical protein